jgi:hypothetical protein
MVTQMTASTSLGCIDDQSHIPACETRHVKFELRLAGRSRLSGKLRRLCSAFDVRCDPGTIDSFLGLIPHDDLKKSPLAGKPGLGVEQFEV